MPNEITFQRAEKIIAATKTLAYWRGQLAVLDKAITVDIRVTYQKGVDTYRQPVTDAVNYKAALKDQTLARSVVAGIRKAWEQNRDEAIRTLRQLGAEVPSS
ncbi:hypothetical protein [Roseixanthobacter glucoisosaccharinicivorans]|uniref:hypothetical protein n=1 Tax=Roseixanthobacter glucoisosaccharinicivorans TaxID=3119923 RepID=UPI00372A9D0D